MLISWIQFLMIVIGYIGVAATVIPARSKNIWLIVCTAFGAMAIGGFAWLLASI